MPGDLDLALRIRADVRSAVTQLRRLDRTLEGAGGAGRRAGRDFNSGARGLDRMERSAGGAIGRLRGLRGAFAGIGSAIAALGIGAAVRSIVRQSDELLELRSRLRLVTDSAGELAETERDLLALSQETRTEYRATADLYARLARSTRELNATDEERLRVTRAVQQAVRISGATNAESTAGVIQFAQGLASNRLAGEELRSVLEQMPRLAQAIADGLDTNIGKLREMAAQGELTGEAVFGALLSQTGALEAEFGQVERTIGQAFTQLRNESQQLFGGGFAESGAREDLLSFLDAIRAGIRSARGADLPRTFEDVTERIREARRELEELDDLEGLDAITIPVLLDKSRLREEIAELTELLPENVDQTLADAEAAIARFADQGVGERDQRVRELRALIARAEAIIAEQDRRTEEALRDERASIGPPAPPPPPEPDAGAEKFLANLERRIALSQAVTHEDRARLELSTKLADATEEQAASILAQARALDVLEAEQKAAADAEAERERAARDLEQRQERARRALADIQVETLGGRERDLALLEREKRELTALVDTLDLSAEEYLEAERVIARYIAAKRVAIDASHDEAEAAEENRRALERERRLREATDAGSGIERALRDVEDIASDAATNIEFAIKNGFQGAEDALVEFVATGKASIGDLVDSIIADLARIVIRQQIVAPLAAALGGLFGGGNAEVGHGGGIAGSLRRSRQVPALAFAGARRLHQGGIAGLRSDEVPAILRREEGVFTPEQMAALGPGVSQVDVRITNSGRPAQVTESSAQVDSGRVVLGISIEDINNGGALDRTLRGTYGLRRTGV